MNELSTRIKSDLLSKRITNNIDDLNVDYIAELLSCIKVRLLDSYFDDLYPNSVMYLFIGTKDHCHLIVSFKGSNIESLKPSKDKRLKILKREFNKIKDLLSYKLFKPLIHYYWRGMRRKPNEFPNENNRELNSAIVIRIPLDIESSIIIEKYLKE